MPRRNPAHQPLSFGVMTLQNIPWNRYVERFQYFESLSSIDTAWVADHFVNPYIPDAPFFDGWAALAGIAQATSRIRIGPLVSNFIYRNPAVLAKQATTIDHISGGRLEFAIGAGSIREENIGHAMTGVPMWPLGERFERFRETVEIVNLLFRNESASYQGKHFQIRDASMRPRPVQQPRPRFTIAAHGPRTLRLAARAADAWNSYGAFGVPPEASLQVTRDRVDMLDQFADAAGRDPGAITRSFLMGLTSDTPFDSDEAFVDFVGRYGELGISEFMFYYFEPGEVVGGPPTQHIESRAALAHLAGEVIPRLKRAD